jgi:AcrR family transcriptional regulator
MEKRKHDIIVHSWELFRKYGIKSISMDDIAREMGMSKKTLYLAVKDKNEIVSGVVGILKELISGFWAVFHDDSLTALKQHCKQKDAIRTLHKHFNPTFAYDLQKYYPELHRELVNWRKSVITESHIANIEKGKREGVFRSDINAEIITKLLVAHHIFTFDPVNEIFSIEEVMDFNIVEQVYMYHLRGISTPKGLEEIEKLFTNEEKLHV